ncbi:DUF4407 domain-containing protein [Mucilaginibacter sp. HC2]|uniref:DUF4407 domain-containing protein n=1 Tax=Mucilaginibacter inviolabilis TaxID=2714892 RepID=UPI00140C1FAC|nr:DUF4407 domain-containing protein [Mucilaginibacter inviolabilis]NHA07379.1 DUF4407 domain-containing protein [Mucilaginibacter inviolabilis]
MKNIYLKLVCFIAGYRYAILKNYDGYSQRKIGVLAISMMFPVGIYALDGWLVSRNICQASIGEAVTSSLVAAGFIFLLEKAIVMTKVSLGLSIFRIAVACGLSFIGAIGLMIDLFHQDVDRQLAVMQQGKNVEYAKIVADKHKKEIADMDRSLAMYLAQYKKFSELAISEPSNVNDPGVGRKTRYYEQQRDITESRFLKPLRAKRDSLVTVMAGEVEKEAKIQEGKVGLLTRIQALFDFSFATGFGRLLCFVCLGVLLGLELMVLALKNGMRKSAFERDEDDYNDKHEQRSQDGKNNRNKNGHMSMTYPLHIAHQ